MRRDQLEHAVRAACQIIGRDAVVVLGSQSILGSFAEDELPPQATMSVEVDILRLGTVPDRHLPATRHARDWLAARG